MKKLSIIFCLVAVILSITSMPVFAVESNEKIVDLGDGFYVVETITKNAVGRAGDTARGNKSGEVYYGSTLIGTATLYAAFDLSGSTAEVQDTSITGSGRNGGTYLRGTASGSGNTAYGTAYFRYNGTQKSVSLSLSCTSDGTLY